MRGDRIFSISVLIFCLVMYMETYKFAKKTSIQSVGPEVFPRAIIIFIAIITTILLINTFVSKSNTPPFDWGKLIPKYGKTIALFAIFGLYVFLLPILNFVLATILFLIAGQAILMGLKPKKVALNLSISFILPFAVYTVFTDFLKIWLP